MSDFDNWLMTDPRDRLPNPYEYWGYVTEDEKFAYAMEEEEDEFLAYLDEWEFFPETIGEGEMKAYTYDAWRDGNKELRHYLEFWFEHGDRQEHLLRLQYPDLFE